VHLDGVGRLRVCVWPRGLLLRAAGVSASTCRLTQTRGDGVCVHRENINPTTVSRFAPRGGGLSGLGPRFTDNIIIYNRVPCEVIKNVTRDDDGAGRERERESCCCSLRVFDATRDVVFGRVRKKIVWNDFILSVIIILLLCRCLLLFVGSASLFFLRYGIWSDTAGRDNRLTDSTWPTDYSGDGGGGWLSRRARPHSLPRQWPTRSHRHDRRDRSILAHHKNI